MVSANGRFVLAVLAAFAVTGCNDQLSGPEINIRKTPDASLDVVKNAQSLVAQGVAGVKKRGEQDEMLKIEGAIPGFGGFFRDSLGQVTVYLKSSSGTIPAVVRSILHRSYADRPEAAVREAMLSAANAVILKGDFSLSELIAIENLISYPALPISGFVGVGVSLAKNRVKIGFEDERSLRAGLESIVAMGIPANSLIPEVWGKFRVATTWSDKIRPVRGGPVIAVINRTAVPWPPNYAISSVGSLGYNVRTTSGATYFMTAGHVINRLRATNGAIGDTVIQPVPRAVSLIGAAILM